MQSRSLSCISKMHPNESMWGILVTRMTRSKDTRPGRKRQMVQGLLSKCRRNEFSFSIIHCLLTIFIFRDACDKPGVKIKQAEAIPVILGGTLKDPVSLKRKIIDAMSVTILSFLYLMLVSNSPPLISTSYCSSGMPSTLNAASRLHAVHGSFIPFLLTFYGHPSSYMCYIPQHSLIPSIALPKSSLYIHLSSSTMNTAWSVRRVLTYLNDDTSCILVNLNLLDSPL